VNELDVALEAAKQAGQIIREAADKPKQISHKGAVDLVTEIDCAAEAAIRAVLLRHTPDIPVLGEEAGGALQASTRWVVDPLDGTTNFVHGFPVFAVSIALEVDGVGRCGVVFDPTRDKAYTALRGQGSFCNDRPMRVSECQHLDTALLGTGFAYDRRTKAPFYLAYVEAFMRRAQGIRRAGAAAMDLAMVADGVLDGFWEFNLSPWDIAAGRLLVEEAGGQFSGHHGGVVDATKPSPLATNGYLHREMIEVLAAVTPPSIPSSGGE
jgi:myo-inositol-1(or 4)-monophosphatase